MTSSSSSTLFAGGLLGLIGLAGSLSATAQAATPPAASNALPQQSALTLSQVLESVERHYPVILGALQDREKARGDHLAARGNFDPVLRSNFQNTPSGEYENRYVDTVLEQPTTLWGTRVFAGYRYGAGKFGPYDERLLTNGDGEVRGGLEVPLLRGGIIDDRRARIQTTQTGLETAERSVEMTRLESRRLASHRYYDWLAAGEKLRIAEGLLRLAEDRDHAMTQRVSKGDAAQVELTDNRRVVNQRQAGLVSAQRSFERASLNLSLFYRDGEGRPLLPSVTQMPRQGLSLPAASPSPGSDELARLTRETVLRHPEVLYFRTLLAQNEVEKRWAQNQILPRLDAELVMAQDMGPGSDAKAIREYKAGIKLEIPLLFRTARGRYDSVASQGAKLGAQLDLSLDRIRVAISDSSQALEAARKAHTITQQELDLALQVEEAERLKFKHGDSNILTVNLREQATADARSRLVDVLAEFNRAHADFEAATTRARE